MQNEYGWWKVTGGTVDFTYNGLASNENGEWVIRDGQVDFGYNGLAEYNGGLFKIAGGLLDNEYTGTYYNDGTYYCVDKGTVKSSAPEGTQEAEMLAINKFVFYKSYLSDVDKTIHVAYWYGKGNIVMTFKNNEFSSISMDTWITDTYGDENFFTFDQMLNVIASIN